MREFFKRFFSWGEDIAIDLGTANTLVYIKERGIVINEPSVLIINSDTGDILSVGMEAKLMLGRTPGNIVSVRPMKDGVISDFRNAEELLKTFIKRARNSSGFIKPRVCICVSSGITEVEKRAVRDSAEHAGAREVYMVAEPMAAAIGLNLPIDTPTGNMVVCIGGGTTEVAVVSLDGIVCSKSIRIGGDEVDEAIDVYMKKTYNLLVGEQTAERIKITIGSAYPLEKEETMAVKGRDLVMGIPKTVKISSREIREAIKEPVNSMVSAVKATLEETPPELASDILDRGITLCGGGSLLKGLDILLNKVTNLPIHIAENAMTCIVEGTGKIFESLDRYKNVLL
ncbi:MAG: rod shape-determining protein [bacterium]